MDTVKAKNFIIIVLLLMDGILLALFGADMVRAGSAESSALEGAIEVLNENGISVSEEIDFTHGAMSVYTTARDEQLERQHVTALMGESEYSDQGGSIIAYSALDGGGDELTLGVFADRADEGIVYHKIMEHIDFRAEGRAGVEAEMDVMVAEGILTAEERAQADAAAIAECLASPVMQTARNSTCYREKSFLMYVPANRVGGGGSGDKVLVQGVIDLLIDGDERIIVDFKNSYLRSAEALEKYKKQLNLYKKAVESSFLGKVDKILLYSFKTGRTVDAERDI